MSSTCWHLPLMFLKGPSTIQSLQHHQHHPHSPHTHPSPFPQYLSPSRPRSWLGDRSAVPTRKRPFPRKTVLLGGLRRSKAGHKTELVNAITRSVMARDLAERGFSSLLVSNANAWQECGSHSFSLYLSLYLSFFPLSSLVVCLLLD